MPSRRCLRGTAVCGASSAVLSVWAVILLTEPTELYKYLVAVIHGLACLLLFLCFPRTIELMHRQSIQLKDFDIVRTDPLPRRYKKRKLKQLFRIVLSFTTACTLGFTMEFAYVRLVIAPEQTSMIEIVGIIGGTLSMLKRVHLLTGRYLLHGLGCYLKKNSMEEETEQADAEKDQTSD